MTSSRPVVIAGAGPVGMTLGLALARQGVQSILLEEDATVSQGSRALGMSRRTLDIWGLLSIGDAVQSRGMPWYGGWAYYRGKLVHEYSIPHEPALCNPPMLNISQSEAEALLAGELTRSAHAELRWNTRLLDLQADEEGVLIRTANGLQEDQMHCRYLVACDGARSRIRSTLGLQLEGNAGEVSYLIVDIQIDQFIEPGRRVWFEPAYHAGGTVLMHGQPDGVWRIDWQLSSEEDVEVVSRPERLRARVDAHLQMMGVDAIWRLVWVSSYRAHARTLPEYSVGRILFAGDAAHQIPIFGVRGLNSGVEDAWNLSWKLARVLDGSSPDTLLQSFSMERVSAARENLRLATRTLNFMTPPTRGQRLARDSVLSLSVHDVEFRDLINPQQATLVPLRDSPLNTWSNRCSEALLPAPGDVLPNVWVEHRSPGGWIKTALCDVLGKDFAVLVLGEPVSTSTIGGAEVVVIARGNSSNCRLRDANGDLHRLLCPGGSAAYLIRPDQHIAACWDRYVEAEVVEALAVATGQARTSKRCDPRVAKPSIAEATFQLLGLALEQIPAANAELFLCKLCLLLALQAGAEVTADAIQRANEPETQPQDGFRDDMRQRMSRTAGLESRISAADQRPA
ncbi:MAG: FAD-dependent oxidoreductase [Bradyrhizobium sp.]|nr:FAD-dependent oxidoreductase [Bradyrhizobium sp.]